jgi:hypothetical protein
MADTVFVDHDYGGAGELTYLTQTESGISGAEVIVFTKADYDAGLRTSVYVRGSTTTDVNGEWKTPMYLDPATYTIVFIKQGFYGPDIKEVTVA